MHPLKKAGEEAYERLVEFPMWDEYGDMLKSDIADMKNIGGPYAGAITAGKFLEHFTDYPWMHFDIAGPTFISKADHYRTKGATGFGVRMLYRYLSKRSAG
jgi:leucyl aminopeptidase